ncbi:MAG: hypothetical protein V7K32_24585 [Nostoc sp.]|uniref:hypothetical protein n=1 Tax=Nostoc sp. TaxID=1180 RepID=UPI002FF84AE6
MENKITNRKVRKELKGKRFVESFCSSLKLGKMAARSHHRTNSRGTIMKTREIHLKLLLGKAVLDSTGKAIGRIEEVRAQTTLC